MLVEQLVLSAALQCLSCYSLQCRCVIYYRVIHHCKNTLFDFLQQDLLKCSNKLLTKVIIIALRINQSS